MSENTYGWIEMQGMAFDGVRIGVNPYEKEITQPVIVDAALWVPTKHAALRDDLAEAVDYAKIARQIKDVVHSQHFNLLETLCETVAEMLLLQPRVERVRVATTKPFGLSNGRVSVRVERNR